jgi:hypothetical protein
VQLLEKNRRPPDQELFLPDPQPNAAPSQRRSSVGSSHLEGCGAGYSVDYVTEKTNYELHVLMRNISIKVSVGYVYPNEDGATHHHMPILTFSVRCHGFLQWKFLHVLLKFVLAFRKPVWNREAGC